ncbi:Phosphate uptake regulator [Halanaeroarchaeum sp. HSR-CO]|uniref:phosphate signaling complex protein PhoU n=1 Tax=Halanaeroarchaeum sp. HSR-CO TaxID=2866382 RepID=UPI00217CD77D|nr:phosphate signaling complex protein PhoU [Halanaeroarchaeum sp. HSR-CO]UWG46345.1 Phosphate uptake regulator [Halanaeroarchaeum sp. HSR-CO]
MPRREYQESLEELRSDIQQLGELVVERFDRSLAALEDTDVKAAKSVIEGDDQINQRYLELESRCIDLFALQQPVAGDLRFIAASFKILTDIERIGDLARNLAQYALRVERQPNSEVAIREIGTAARELVADALDAFGTEDAATCHRIADRDDHIDALCHSASERVVRDLIEREATADDPWSVEQVLDDVSVVLLTIRDLERVADHGVNIAARTLYLVENDPELIY